MARPLLVRLAGRVASGDASWVIHRARMWLGLRQAVARPEPMRSQVAWRERSATGPLALAAFSHNLDHEGASISLQELLVGLKRRGVIDPHVIAFGEGPLREGYEGAGIRVDVIPDILDLVSTPRRLEAQVRQLAERIARSGAEIALVNTLHNFPAILAAERAGIPSLWNPRESEPWDRAFDFVPAPVAQMAIAAMGLPRRVVFVAQATREVWRSFENGDRFRVIPNALDPARFADALTCDRAKSRESLGWRQEEVVFLSVGTVCERKGQVDAVAALAQVVGSTNAPIRLVLAGGSTGRYARDVRSRARAIRAQGACVEFVDATRGIGTYYRAADAFVLCSRIESYPRVVLEALAFGLPVVTTPVFGVAEQLPNPGDARRYEPGDVDRLANHLREIVEDADARCRLGQRARARFEELGSFDQMLGRYDAVLREVMNSGRGAGSP